MAPRTRSSPARPAGDLRSRAGEPSVVAASEALVSEEEGGGRFVLVYVPPRFPRGKSGRRHDLAVDMGGGARRRPILPRRRVGRGCHDVLGFPLFPPRLRPSLRVATRVAWWYYRLAPAAWRASRQPRRQRLPTV